MTWHTALRYAATLTCHLPEAQQRCQQGLVGQPMGMVDDDQLELAIRGCQACVQAGP